MKISKKKAFYAGLWVVAALIILSGLAAAWLYTGKISAFKTSLFKKFPLPLALVDWHPLFMGNFIDRQNLATKLPGEATNPQNIFNQLIYESETSQLASGLNMSPNQKQIDQEYESVAKLVDLKGQKNFEALLQSYNLSENFYKSQILKPRLELRNLQIWFNSQRNLNAQAYATADSLQSQIKNGGDMGQLAEQYTQDPTGKSTQGDLGFVQDTDLLPELREPVDNMRAGDVNIVISRLGLNLIKLESKDGNRMHLRLIFLNTGDFGQWLKSRAQDFFVIKLLRV